jgi:hypothetical protein
VVTVTMIGVLALGSSRRRHPQSSVGPNSL